MSVIKIFFSPSETTKKVVNLIGDNFEGKSETYDLLYFGDEKELSSDDIVIVGAPIFAGRIPKTTHDRLVKFKGNGAKAIAVANYGNANIGDALHELVDILKENDFNVIAAATTVSHHSIFSNVAINRPDEDDIVKINQFAKDCIEKIASGDVGSIEVDGEKPYSDYKTLPFEISCDESVCVFCLECISICPEKAIREDDPVVTDFDLCTRCTACINICPENARSFTGDAFEAKKPQFESANSQRKEPEFYV